MKNKTNTTLGYSIAVAAITAIGTIGVAHAGWTDAPGEAGVMNSGYFTDFGAGGSAPTFDRSMHDKVNLGWLSTELWTPKSGAQGPLRDGGAEALAAQYRDIESRLGTVGGRDTP
ncbi:MAG: hypothetical protein Q8L56_14930 [Rhodocyclaceae bacterium]|nr:hypothetical protein [Rhodocyclaceae bacterium]